MKEGMLLNEITLCDKLPRVIGEKVAKIPLEWRRQFQKGQLNIVLHRILFFFFPRTIGTLAAKLRKVREPF